MRQVGFPLCCGATIINDFGATSVTAGTATPITIEELNATLDLYKKGMRAFQVAILNTPQDRKYGKTLVENGFMHVSTGKNPNHYGLCHMYVRNRKPNK